MKPLLRRLSAVVLALALMAGNAGLCIAWVATPDARMECCHEGAPCAKHSSSHGSHAQHLPMPANDNDCCAFSERQQRGPSSAITIVPVSSEALPPAAALPARVSPLVLHDAWRITAPPPGALVSRHVLLSVFLV